MTAFRPRREPRIYPQAQILDLDRVEIGTDVIVDDFVFVGRHSRLVIGNFVHVASHTSITGGGECLIGDFVGLSSGVRLFSGSDDFLGDGLLGPTIPDEYRCVTRGRLIVGAFAIIGANSVVLPNVTVGEGAAVGAGSVVTRDLRPWTLYVGAPARPVRERPRAGVLAAAERLFAEHGPPERHYRFGGV